MSLSPNSKADLKSELYFYYFLIVASLLTFAFGLYVAQRSIVLSQNGVAAQGEIVAIERRTSGSTNSNPQDSFHPVIEFIDTQNRQYRFESDLSIEPAQVSIGERIEVLYLQEDPGNAAVNSWQGLWLWPMLCTLISLTLALTGVFAIRGVRKKMQS